MSFPLQQTFAQTNESVKILIDDAIEDLQNNDTNTALTHSNLASQELSSQGVSSSDSALVLIHDAIQDLQYEKFAMLSIFPQKYMLYLLLSFCIHQNISRSSSC